MSVFKHEQPRRQDETEAADQEWTVPQTAELDDILDDIDAVLDVNAEEFVRGFVQKGGE